MLTLKLNCAPKTASTSAIGFLSMILAAAQISAATLALYDFEDQDYLSNDTDADTVAGDLTLSNFAGLEISDQHTNAQVLTSDDLTFDAPTSGFALAGSYGDIQGGTKTAALDHNISVGRYLSFTLTPGANTEINLNSFTMTMEITDGTADKFVGIFSDIGGFAVGDQIGVIKTYDPAAGAAENQTFDLSSLGTITSATEFRLYFATGASTAGHGFAVDNLTLDGTTTVVPEPSAFALIAGCFGLTWVMLRRR